MAIIDVVKWNASPDELVWKFPSDDLSTATRLIVSTAQEAFVVLGGEVSDAYGPGTHILDTDNVPLLRNLVKIPFGGQTPYSAEVWFVQKTMPLNLLWGTQDPIQILDPAYKIPVPVRCYGQFGIQIQNAQLFLKTLVGTYNEFDTARLCDYFKAMVQTKVKTLIAGCFKNSGCSVFEINTHLDALSTLLSKELAIGFADFGVGLINFYVQSVNFPQDDPAITAIRSSLAKRADMEILGYNYTQERSFDVLQGAAENEGSAGAIAGAGIGLVLAASATTGGTDLFCALIHKRLKHYSVPQLLIVADGLIVLGGVAVFGINESLYAAIAIFITAKMSDRILEGLKFSKMAYIVSEYSAAIAEEIMQQMDRGVTALQATGMYSGKARKMLLCVVSKKEIAAVLDIVNRNDRNAFVIISDAREVMGEGFIENVQ